MSRNFRECGVLLVATSCENRCWGPATIVVREYFHAVSLGEDRSVIGCAITFSAEGRMSNSVQKDE